MSASSLEPRTPEDVAAAVAGTRLTLLPRGRGTKPALSSPPDDAVSLELGGLRGLVEYEPSEFTVTVLAGTPVAEVAKVLLGHGQYLPFDPLFAEAGSTVGGSVAAGTNGPGRVRYGGVRDFLLGVRFADGRGRLVRGGGKVVKNAAGFDLPKLMVGSLGRLGVLVELTFKVFPAPEGTKSLRAVLPSLEAAIAVVRRLAGRPFDLDALELLPPGELWVRIAGPQAALVGRADRLRQEIRRAGASAIDLVDAGEADAWWRTARELSWVPRGHGLVKVPLTPGRIVDVDRRIPSPTPRRYGGAGQQLLVAWPAGEDGGPHWGDGLARMLEELELPGLVLDRPSGTPGEAILGSATGARQLAVRIKSAMDPERRFLPLPRALAGGG